MTEPKRTHRDEDLAEEITAYWDARATTYSNGVVDELAASRRGAWAQAIVENASATFELAERQGRPVRALDLGCGPGFFTTLLACMGCAVVAIDASAEMLAHARQNVEEASPEADVTFVMGDLQELPFPDGSFDLAVCRNVMWLMQEPEAAYAEWLRVLAPGGTLLVFDANWYLYLADTSLDLIRHTDQDGKSIEEWSEDSLATPEQERRCEIIASQLPLTPILRPQWDLEVLARLDTEAASADTDIWQRLWTEGEKAFYRTSPLFLVRATKAGADSAR